MTLLTPNIDPTIKYKKTKPNAGIDLKLKLGQRNMSICPHVMRLMDEPERAGKPKFESVITTEKSIRNTNRSNMERSSQGGQTERKSAEG